jgi:hypothetical protein
MTQERYVPILPVNPDNNTPNMTEAENVSSYLQSEIFNNPDNVKSLAIGKLGATSVFETTGIEERINSLDSQGKLVILGNLLSILSDDTHEMQNSRDTALEILHKIDFTGADPEEIRSKYARRVKAIHNGKNKPDNPTGNIYALLQTGIILSPFMRGDTHSITREWKRVVIYFHNKEQKQIKQDAANIRLKVAHSYESDMEILELRKQGYTVKQIAEMKEKTPTQIHVAINRLNDAGILTDFPSGKPRKDSSSS